MKFITCMFLSLLAFSAFAKTFNTPKTTIEVTYFFGNVEMKTVPFNCKNDATEVCRFLDPKFSSGEILACKSNGMSALYKAGDRMFCKAIERKGEKCVYGAQGSLKQILNADIVNGKAELSDDYAILVPTDTVKTISKLKCY